MIEKCDLIFENIWNGDRHNPHDFLFKTNLFRTISRRIISLKEAFKWIYFPLLSKEDLIMILRFVFFHERGTSVMSKVFNPKAAEDVMNTFFSIFPFACFRGKI